MWNVLVFECVRELLFNAVKHARVGRAQVRLRQMEGNRGRIVVSDDGAGFDVRRMSAAGDNGGGFGLFSIYERIDLIGGSFETDSAPGKGSRLTLAVPPGLASEPPATDDHALFRDGLARIVGRDPAIRVVGQARDGREAIADPAGQGEDCFMPEQ